MTVEKLVALMQKHQITLSDNLSQEKDNRITVLAYAMHAQNAALVKYLCSIAQEEELKTHLHTDFIQTSLAHVCLFSPESPSQVEILKILLQHDIDANQPFVITRAGDSYNLGSAIHKSVELALLSAGADINAVDNDGETPLYFASRKGVVEAVALLLCEKSIKPDLCNSDGFTPLIIAKCGDITTELLHRGADIGYEVPGTEKAALEYAIRNGQIDKVSAVIEYGMVHHKQCMYKQLERNVRALTCEMAGVLGIPIAARRLTEKKHYAEAISLFHFAQDIGLGTDEYELEGLAHCYYHTEAHADQIEHCKKRALQNMECPTPHFFLYRCYQDVGLYELALLSMEIFLHRAHGKQEFEKLAAEVRVEMSALRRKLLQKK